MLDLQYNYYSIHDLESDASNTSEGKATGADVVCWSACMDNEMAEDSSFGKGYMSNAFIKDESASYLQMFSIIREACPGEQTPQLTASHPLNAGHKFIM